MWLFIWSPSCCQFVVANIAKSSNTNANVTNANVTNANANVTNATAASIFFNKLATTKTLICWCLRNTNTPTELHYWLKNLVRS